MRSQLCNRREISKVDQKDVGFRDAADLFNSMMLDLPPHAESPGASRGSKNVEEKTCSRHAGVSIKNEVANRFN